MAYGRNSKSRWYGLVFAIFPFKQLSCFGHHLIDLSVACSLTGYNYSARHCYWKPNFATQPWNTIMQVNGKKVLKDHQLRHIIICRLAVFFIDASMCFFTFFLYCTNLFSCFVSIKIKLPATTLKHFFWCFTFFLFHLQWQCISSSVILM
jgi:hypothetical protein